MRFNEKMRSFSADYRITVTPLRGFMILKHKEA